MWTRTNDRRALESPKADRNFLSMHYPHKSSNIKRVRNIGFRARMKTKKGRQMINRKRRVGRRVQVV